MKFWRTSLNLPPKTLKRVLLLLLIVRKIVCGTHVKLLLDENLSNRIIDRIIDLYPGSAHVKTLALIQSEDAMIWEYARVNDFVISKDSDFHQRSFLYGHPPKFIYLRVGNCPTSQIVQILRHNYVTISQFGNAEQESILVLA